MAHSIGRLRRPPTISNDCSSETNWPIITKFHIQPSWPLETKSCSSCLGYMTNMAPSAIYGKQLRISSPEPIDDSLETWSVASSIRVLPRLFKL